MNILDYIRQTRTDVTWIKGPNLSNQYTWDTSLPNQQEIIDLINSFQPSIPTGVQIVSKIIEDAIVFGNSLIVEFAAENVIMGITQDGMTGTVRKRMEQVILALSTGSLYDAISEAKAIPEQDKDTKYITNARLLQFVNKLETYLQIPLSIEL